jgi:hypothetical protein
VSEHQTTAPRNSPRLSDSARRGLRGSHVGLGVAAALAIATGVVGLWLVFSHDSSSPSSPASFVKPVALSASGLRTLARHVPEPIYWAGPRKGYLYELRRTEKDDIYIRYLPPGVNAGARGAKYLVVASYPFPGALDALEKVAHGKGIRLRGGGLALVNQSYPKSVHLAFPNVDYQVEVYDPSPARALAVASSGEVRRVR